jgi:hypothetical protein
MTCNRNKTFKTPVGVFSYQSVSLPYTVGVVQSRTHADKKLQIKFEVDVDPPMPFATEAQYILQPTPFSVRTYKQEFLFAGKMHAVLCRQWQRRIKGRDWYDFVWFVGRNTPLHLAHLRDRMVQSGDWSKEKNLHKKIF